MPWQFDLASAIGGRAEQQDRVAVLPVPGCDDTHLVVLADGMGGRQQGAEAAQAVVDSARAAVGGFAGCSAPGSLLHDLCLAADEAIRALGRRSGSDPGSTCALLYLAGREAYWAHVGDSRLYHFDARRLLFRTADHSMDGLLDGQGDAGTGIRRDGRLYMCLGGQNRLDPEIGSAAVGGDDWFLLCSDGLWGLFDDSDLRERLSRAPLQGSAERIAALASRRAGRASDNISLVLARQQPGSLLQRIASPRRLFGR